MHSLFIQELEKDIERLLPLIEARGLRIDTEKMGEVIANLKGKREVAEARAYDLLKTPKAEKIKASVPERRSLSEDSIRRCH